MKESHLFKYEKEFELVCGGSLPRFELHYTTYGQLNADKSNVIWICHALTGNSDFTEWWPGLFGEGMAFDPNKYFVVCANVLGGCYGSTGPLSMNPETKDSYFHAFPRICNKDVIRSFDLLRQELGIDRIHCLVGGSLGGQHAIEWAVTDTGIFENAVVIASNARHSPWGVAFNESQRMAIESDVTWQLDSANAGLEGMKVARSIAILSYRHYEGFGVRQAEVSDEKMDDFRAASYQRYQGQKLTTRFNAFTYYNFSKMMDAHNVGRGRGGVEAALGTIKAKCLYLGIDTDILFPVSEQEMMHKLTPNSELAVIKSKFGHDGFLIELDQVESILKDFIKRTS